MKLKGDKEIIIVDGGSEDKTVNKILSHNVKLVNSEKGRARQMNKGAKASKGEVLWFVHSDSKLDNASIIDIGKAIDEGYDGGCFSLYFYDYSNLKLKFIAWSSNLRAKYLKLMFGDQGIFIKKSLFKRLGCFKEIPIMEDWEMSKDMHRYGKVKVLKNKIGTSARRFIHGGEIRTLLKMHKIKIMHIKGKSPEEISNHYKDIR